MTYTVSSGALNSTPSIHAVSAGRHIQVGEHDSVEDARAAMELFKRVRSSGTHWQSTDHTASAAAAAAGSSSRDEDALLSVTRHGETQQPCSGRQRLGRRRRGVKHSNSDSNNNSSSSNKRQRVDSCSEDNVMRYLSDHYWPEDIQLASF